MSIAVLDSSVENQKGGYIKPNQIKLLKYPFSCVAPLLSLSGTLSPIVCLFHHIFHIPRAISATGRAEVMRAVDDSQRHALSAVGSSDGSNPDGNKLDGSNPYGSKWADRG